MKHLFLDLDGTVTESKQFATLEMSNALRSLKQDVIIVSGAEYSRMLVQLPIDCINFPQNGNEVWEHGKMLWKNELFDKDEIRKHIMRLAIEMDMGINDDMIDDRGSQISFSFVGHHAPFEKKKAFDSDRKIRMGLLDKLPFPKAVIGGTTCIDYIPYTKGQNIKRYIDLKGWNVADCLYIGDSFMPYGNDTTVMGVIPVFEIKSPLETYNFIKTL